MWKKKNPLASFAFYVNFSFPIVGPILIAFVLFHSIAYSNLLLFLLFLLGFILLGLVFALFVRVHLKEKDWIAIPIFSTLFVFLFVWQMPIALITLNDTKWGTR